MSFLYGGKHCKYSNNYYRNQRFNKKYDRDSHKKQKSRHFVRYGMRKNAFFIYHHCRNLVYDFYKNNHQSPNPDPIRKCQHRNQLDATASHKNDVRQTVQQRSCFALAMELSSQIAIKHIADAASVIDCPKGYAIDIKKQDADAPQKPKRCYDIGKVFHLVVKFFNASLLFPITITTLEQVSSSLLSPQVSSL